MSLSQLTSWPPSQTSDQIEKLQDLAITYALANSLILKPVIPAPDGATHAPFALFPSPFPRNEFEKALRIQTSYNKLYAQIASNPKFLRELIGKSVSKVDPFIGRLYSIWDRIDSKALGSKLALGIFRSDYLLHLDEQHQDQNPVIKQVEFNTVSVSFGSLGTKVSGLHRYLTTTTNAYSQLKLPQPINHGLPSLAKGLAAAHQAYISLFQPKGSLTVLMITQPHERNLFDQALLVHALAENKDRIRMVRLSCHEILTSTELDKSNSTLYYLEHGQRTEVSVVYYRCMYGPEDFLSEDDWNGRERLESSRSINCPNLATQLAGCKKIQQVLTDPNSLKGQLELDNLLDQTELDELRSTWMPIHALDEHAVKLASDPITATRFVLKPQREGGGHNIYGDRIPDFLKKLSIEERDGYILMQLIQTPTGIRNVLIRPGSSVNREPVEVISELGVLGVCLFKTDQKGALEVIWNTEAGHLLRTKNSESDEGGVAVGISCLDSPYLV